MDCQWWMPYTLMFFAGSIVLVQILEYINKRLKKKIKKLNDELEKLNK